MTRRDPGRGPLFLVAVAAILAVTGYAAVFGVPGADGGARATAPTNSPDPHASVRPASPGAAQTAPAAAPVVKVVQDTCCAQTARFLDATWTSSESVAGATIAVTPTPPFACRATVDQTRKAGSLTCDGLLAGATPYVATLTVETSAGRFPVEHRFRTMGDRLENVRWFTEFEDPTKEPLACAAASARIVQVYTTGGQDPMTAEQILEYGRTFNRSRDPGLDPAAIATVQKKLDARNDYHYYRFSSKEQATKAAVYWLLRSGKPVHMITLAGQHDPVLIGFRGTFGSFLDDPANVISGMVVQDPQRGDLDPRTQSRRPDKYRSVAFQTGALLGMDEWYRDEWWFGFAYVSALDGVNIDRNDGAYQLPHWAGTYTIIVDDGDAEWPSDREGRVRIGG